MKVENKEKIIQIIPVTDEVYAVYSQENGTEEWVKILFAVLIEHHEERFATFWEIDSDGICGSPRECSNFLRYELPRKTVKPKDGFL